MEILEKENRNTLQNECKVVGVNNGEEENLQNNMEEDLGD